MASDASNSFEAEVERLRREGVPGASGRLRELFDYLAARGPDGEPATQAEIGAAVFGQADADSDDATVRVYIHRLRKRLEDHYSAHPAARAGTRLEIPAGIYALRLGEKEADEEVRPAAEGAAASPRRGLRRFWPAFAVLALLAAFIAGWAVDRGVRSSANALWQPFLETERPILIVLGDYYIFGEIDPIRPEEGRLIRDFRVDSPEDLRLMQELEPERFGNAEDVGLNYLPFSVSYALEEIVPLLAASGKETELIAASALTPDMLNRYDVVYLGLLSGMGPLEELAFGQGGFRLGESYDEIIDRATGQIWTSEEARSLASPAFYRDYAYVARFEAPGGALVAVVAGQRDTGLRGIAPIAAADELPEEVARAAQGGDAFEALVQITGQQGADLNERLIVARPRE